MEAPRQSGFALGVGLIMWYQVLQNHQQVTYPHVCHVTQQPALRQSTENLTVQLVVEQIVAESGRLGGDSRVQGQRSNAKHRGYPPPPISPH